MLHQIISAIGRVVSWAADKGVEIMLIPVHAVLMHLFPAAYEPLPIFAENDRAVFSETLPFDPFERTEDTVLARETEANLVLAWAAEVSLSGAEVPLPGVTPELRSWLASLSDGELTELVGAGMDAVYAHLYLESKSQASRRSPTAGTGRGTMSGTGASEPVDFPLPLCEAPKVPARECGVAFCDGQIALKLAALGAISPDTFCDLLSDAV